MDLANMRSLGVRSIFASCDCGRAAAVDVSALAGSIEVLAGPHRVIQAQC